MKTIIAKDKKTIFIPILIVLFNLLLSNVGYGFIVKYLYVVSGIFSGIYVISLVILIVIKIVKLNKERKQKNNLLNKDEENK